SSVGSSHRTTDSTSSIPVTLRDFDAYQRCCCIHSRSSSRSTSWSIVVVGPLLIVRLFLFRLDELEPVEAAWSQRQQVRPLADTREARAAEQLHRIASFVLPQVELHRLRG